MWIFPWLRYVCWMSPKFRIFSILYYTFIMDSDKKKIISFHFRIFTRYFADIIFSAVSSSMRSHLIYFTMRQSFRSLLISSIWSQSLLFFIPLMFLGFGFTQVSNKYIQWISIVRILWSRAKKINKKKFKDENKMVIS